MDARVHSPLFPSFPRAQQSKMEETDLRPENDQPPTKGGVEKDTEAIPRMNQVDEMKHDVMSISPRISRQVSRSKSNRSSTEIASKTSSVDVVKTEMHKHELSIVKTELNNMEEVKQQMPSTTTPSDVEVENQVRPQGRKKSTGAKAKRRPSHRKVIKEESSEQKWFRVGMKIFRDCHPKIRDQVEILEYLGKGSYGVVMKSQIEVYWGRMCGEGSM
jgi:hypothetical protein